MHPAQQSLGSTALEGGASTWELSHLAGTMTFGEQNTEEEAWEQLDYAVSQGVNFIDTAELYPVPPRPETCGTTEEYIGRCVAPPPGGARNGGDWL